MKKNMTFLTFLLSLSIHIIIFTIPINIEKSPNRPSLKFYVVDLKKIDPTAEHNNNGTNTVQDNTPQSNQNSNPQGINSKKIPTTTYSFDRDSYHQEFLMMLREKLNIKDYLEQTGLEGEYLFQIEIEGSGKVRSIKTLRKQGSTALEHFVKSRLSTIVFPPHGELTITIKVNMVFTLEQE
ncbi:MAG: hypothetical protein N3C60_02720 [Calditerrivibrio sp.]|nr:hypothetical protein [Calditerrivibrio sp.]